MKNNTYLEEIKINAVKRYLNEEQKMDICRDLGVAKSTMWGWICKYSSLVKKEWEIEDFFNNHVRFRFVSLILR